MTNPIPMMAAGAATIKKVFLELGGKSAFLVLEDADLAAACSMAGFTAAVHAGQGCAITTRLVVPRARYDEAVAAAAARRSANLSSSRNSLTEARRLVTFSCSRPGHISGTTTTQPSASATR